MTTKTVTQDQIGHLTHYLGTLPPQKGEEGLEEKFKVKGKKSIPAPDEADYGTELDSPVTLTWFTDFTPQQEAEWDDILQRTERKKNKSKDDIIEDLLDRIEQLEKKNG